VNAFVVWCYFIVSVVMCEHVGRKMDVHVLRASWYLQGIYNNLGLPLILMAARIYAELATFVSLVDIDDIAVSVHGIWDPTVRFLQLPIVFWTACLEHSKRFASEDALAFGTLILVTNLYAVLRMPDYTIHATIATTLIGVLCATHVYKIRAFPVPEPSGPG
jgi:hypothetical protein